MAEQEVQLAKMHRLDHGVAKMESAIREKDEEIAGFRRQLAERQPVFFAVSLPVAESNMDLRDPLPPRGEAEMIPSATLSRLPVGMARDLQPPEPASTSGSGSASCSASTHTALQFRLHLLLRLHFRLRLLLRFQFRLRLQFRICLLSRFQFRLRPFWTREKSPSPTQQWKGFKSTSSRQ